MGIGNVDTTVKKAASTYVAKKVPRTSLNGNPKRTR
jgi:hypothetical protein